MDSAYNAVLRDAATGTWLHFEQPEKVIEAFRLDEILPALRQIETLVNQNQWYAVGFISYEASPAFDSALLVRATGDFPLLWFALYRRVRQTTTLPPGNGEYQLANWLSSVNRESYNSAISQIKAQIARGNTYQVNYTFRLSNKFSGSEWTMFVDMVNSQAPGYSAFIDTGSKVICSASPELFFNLDGNHVDCRPMKGTARRGLTLNDDNAQANWLNSSIKNRAENVMIVDMIRNDLGRLAEIGTVTVPELFTIERYPTLLQMTSSITAEIHSPFTDLMSALFPCASITGAPKASTMKIIAATETTPRQLYTGTIGYLAPDRKAQFNVAIRTLLIDRKTGDASYGVGGGIVWDSTQKDEYAEALLKAQVLSVRNPDFSLLETLRWTPEEGFFLLDEHLKRLVNSAVYFGFPCNIDKTRTYMKDLVNNLETSPHRIRLLLSPNGGLSHQSFPLLLDPQKHPVVRLRLATSPINLNNKFLYHKTTERTEYDDARKSQPDCDDVLLFNERGELTESTIANLVVELNGEFITPPISCGLLGGTFRAHLLGQKKIQEKIIFLTDLPNCAQIFLVNSVRGWQKAVLIDKK